MAGLHLFECTQLEVLVSCIEEQQECWCHYKVDDLLAAAIQWHSSPFGFLEVTASKFEV